MTRNADIIDAATELTDRERDDVLARHRAEYARRPVNEHGLCIDCDDPINPRRLAADPRAARCVPCQEMAEARARHRRRF